MDDTYAVDGAELHNVRRFANFCARRTCLLFGACARFVRSHSDLGVRGEDLSSAPARPQVTLVGKIVSITFNDQLVQLEVDDGTGKTKVDRWLEEGVDDSVRCC